MSLIFSAYALHVQMAALAKVCDDGWIDLMPGEPPANPSVPVFRSLALASLRFGSPAFQDPRDGIAISHALTGEADAPSEGTPTWFRVYAADHQTVICDGTIGPEGDIQIDDPFIERHAKVALESLSFRL